MRFLIAVMVLLIAGCGTTPEPTKYMSNNLTNKVNKVGLITYTTKTAETHIYGASCLLCYGVASALTSSLDKHLKSLPTSDIESINTIVKKEIEDNGMEVVDFTPSKPIDKLKKFKAPKETGFAKKDFTALKNDSGLDAVAVVRVLEHGAHRTFSNYIPTSNPQGYVKAIIYIVDLNTNEYIHYQPINFVELVEGEWDEPNSFPGVTNAYFQAIEKAKATIRNLL